jgi:DnaJ-class molecular chaperone
MPGFGGIGGMGGQQQQRHQKKVQEVRTKITLKEIYFGCEKTVEFQINKKCDSCEGFGNTEKKKNICSICKGQGMRVHMSRTGNMIRQQTMPCDACKQKGFIKNKEKECKKCVGKGTVHNITTKKIPISKNFDYKTKMKLTNYGNYDTDSQTNADVYIVYELDITNMEINNYDIIIRHKINIWDALSGYSMYYEHADGKKYYFKFDNVIKHLDITYVKNIGLPECDESKRGKLFIIFEYIYPTAVMDSENLKLWFRNKEKSQIVNKSDFKKEKTYNVSQEEFQHLCSNTKETRTHKPTDNETSDDDGPQNGPQCVQQ